MAGLVPAIPIAKAGLCLPKRDHRDKPGDDSRVVPTRWSRRNRSREAQFLTRWRRALTFLFKDDGLVPNNPSLPALVYKSAIDLSGASEPEAEIEKLFTANGWSRDLWRDGIFSYVHYHSMIHEALGVARGRARVQLGGHDGEVVEFAAGDIAVLPAGTGHQRLIGSEDFSVVGAYPPEGAYNLCRGDNPAARGKALTTIPQVPLPQSDPVFGKDGPLLTLWRRP